MEYRQIRTAGTSDVEAKASHFLGEACAVFSEEEAQARIAALRKEHYTARHVCYAYCIQKEPADEKASGPDLVRASDDGEPQGTAGRPILSVIEGAGVRNCLITVVRYFGGTLLGTGGLVRAYTQAAQEALGACDIATMLPCEVLRIRMDYGLYNSVKYYLDERGISYENESFSDHVALDLIVRETMTAEVRDKLAALSAGKIQIELIRKGSFPV